MLVVCTWTLVCSMWRFSVLLVLRLLELLLVLLGVEMLPSKPTWRVHRVVQLIMDPGVCEPIDTLETKFLRDTCS
jgi:hypothetical protein